ncbi:MAG TPA: SMP-30/gluconolactonase/LRE family protein [Vicinamibacterales bacterium]|jgi:gluconolactonase
MPHTLSRRDLFAALGGAVCVPHLLSAQAPARQGGPTVISTPPRTFGPDATLTTYFPDPDLITVDPAFGGLIQGNTTIVRLWTGALWAEGPAWSPQGRYLLWSDIPNNRQYRWMEDDGHVSVFRSPSNYSNGNSFDAQGRQLSCEHATRRVVRYEHDGSVTVIADAYQGKRLNSPNDIVAHRDGALWFTDPPYGQQLYEGGASRQPSRELPTNVYRVDASGRLDVVITEDQVPDPNGLAFSPDYRRLYVTSTGKGPGDKGDGGKGEVYVFDVGADNRVSNKRLFTDCMIDGVKCGPDGVRCDVDGNVWLASSAGPVLGYSGVTVWNPAGKLLGRIRLPEVCANITFGGQKRNRLFMCASQSIYAVYVGTQGA